MANYNRISAARVSVATKPGRNLTYLDGLPSVRLHDPLITSSCEITWTFKTTISTIWVSMATKLARMVTYLDGLLPRKSNETLITRFCELTWQSEIIICPPLQCLWPPNLASWWLAIKGFYSMLHHPLITWSCEIAWQIKLYLHYHNIYGNKIWQDGDLSLLSFKVKWPHNHVTD